MDLNLDSIKCKSYFFYLELIDPPGPPENPSVEDVTSSSCQVSWQTPKFDGGSQITGYHVERRQTDSSRWIKVTKSLVSELTFKVTDLIQGNQYEFRVFAENKVGPGPPCSPTKPVLAKEPYGKMFSPSLYNTSFLWLEPSA